MNDQRWKHRSEVNKMILLLTNKYLFYISALFFNVSPYVPNTTTTTKTIYNLFWFTVALIPMENMSVMVLIPKWNLAVVAYLSNL